MVFSCILRCHQTQYPAFRLIDSGASGFAIMDQDFVQKHLFLPHKLKYPCKLFGFDR